jgi:hypothetical protein
MFDAYVNCGMLCALLGYSQGTQHPKDPLNREEPGIIRPQFALFIILRETELKLFPGSSPQLREQECPTIK